MMTQMEIRLDRLESIEAIKNLKAKYCHYCDQNYDPEGLASLFTEDAVWDAGEKFGRYKGKEAIKGFFAGISKDISFAAHLTMNPVIDVDGNMAKGEWRIFMPATMNDSQAAWLLAKYDEVYVRENNAWLIKDLKANIQFFAPYDKGWAIQQFM